MRPIPLGNTGKVEVLVTDEMTVDFAELGRVHPVYASYWLAKHMAEAGRKIILPFLEPEEEGIGSALAVRHRAPALPGMRLEVLAEHTATEGNRVLSRCRAWSDLGELVGDGETEQVVLARAGLERRLDALRDRMAEQNRRIA